jgi:diguanylate cyclase (GGDEF)-like protein/PAS domain S-box-containing protein
VGGLFQGASSRNRYVKKLGSDERLRYTVELITDNSLPENSGLRMIEPIAPGELERIKFLHALELLDTPDDEAFDRVTRVLARTLDMPIALISLAGEQRQCFKSRVGLDILDIPRELALCSHAILQKAPLVVGDTTADPRFSDNPLVLGFPHIRFYAGVPLLSGAGFAVGTLCVIDAQPRTLDQDQLDTLVDLADIVSRELQLREKLLLARTQMKKSDEFFVASEANYRTMFELASVGIALVAPDGSWISVNDALCRIVGYSRSELRWLTFQDITHGEDLDADMELLNQLIENKIIHYQMEKRYLQKDGKSVWINLSVTKKSAADGSLEYFISIIQDIQARKELEQEARHDVLTGLVNRRALDELLPIAQARASRIKRQLAVLFIDLDGFKSVNDTHGHEVGDDLLRAIAGRLKSNIRLNDSIARYAGDEFIVLLEGLEDGHAQAHEVAEKLLHAIAAPVPLAGVSVEISASIGIAIYEANSSATPDDLIKESDHWMYRAKRAGKNRVLP